MEEMVSYVFGALNKSEVAFKNIDKTFKHVYKALSRQSRLNKLTTLAMCALTANVVMQSKKIDALREEVDKLKSERGESQCV